ncbi:hypothetical protein PtA15_3A88 [Puccinia triticina]|uniref:Uncharacterized protein n=1 Tax=Puccinia triticina TaxID=208348 RepID=A0ABY7CC08_9BASI|nr:uncharacterized protein PtA15_3A88 [Puccinia triticina]WAQ82724.1 hypothetical protein PtA15_3A88 [Puccinia triticina]
MATAPGTGEPLTPAGTTRVDWAKLFFEMATMTKLLFEKIPKQTIQQPPPTVLLRQKTSSLGVFIH